MRKVKNETRYDRAKLFETFQATGQSVFEKFKNEDNNYQKFHDYYSLCICPKGRMGGVDNRKFEVFYGNRIFDLKKKIKSDLSVEDEFLTEHGTILSFQLNDHGYVAIMLFPSRTEYTKAQESAIFVDNYIHPYKLNELFLKKYWNYLNSYMEYTSIDGCPTTIDKIRHIYLKYFKNLVIDGKYHQKKITTWLLSAVKYAFTVGLSGFLIFIFTILPKMNDKETNKQLNSIQSDLEEIIKNQKNQIEKISKDTIFLKQENLKIKSKSK
ncbi:MAG: hypothetical protein LBK94_08140 [Prevotellaceae bacterium]|jgi:hypothetical protein|nr:hypothetical protein [Prevotellaceae bacterium]